MTVIIDYKNSSKKNKLSNLVLFCNEKFDISGLNRHVSSKEYSYILDLIKTKDTKKKIHSFELSSKRKIISAPSLPKMHKTFTNAFAMIKIPEFCTF